MDLGAAPILKPLCTVFFSDSTALSPVPARVPRPSSHRPASPRRRPSGAASPSPPARPEPRRPGWSAAQSHPRTPPVPTHAVSSSHRRLSPPTPPVPELAGHRRRHLTRAAGRRMPQTEPPLLIPLHPCRHGTGRLNPNRSTTGCPDLVLHRRATRCNRPPPPTVAVPSSNVRNCRRLSTRRIVPKIGSADRGEDTEATGYPREEVCFEDRLSRPTSLGRRFSCETEGTAYQTRLGKL